jgi:hypothetical protein
MPDSAIATAADYADALITARRAKNVLVLLLLLMLLAQLAIFFAARYTNVMTPAVVTTTTTTAPTTTVVAEPNQWFEKLQYVVGLTDFLGVTLSIVLSIIVLLLVQIMLVGRLIGVSRVTSAFIWALVLIVLLFPWQAFLNNVAFDRPEFKIPGVLYTWDEVRLFAKFGMDRDHPIPLAQLILQWSRFVAFPVISVLILLAIQIKSNRGLRQALGEADYAIDETLRT